MGNGSFRDGIGVKGHLTIRIFDAKTKALLQTIDTPNKIMFFAADVLVELIAQRASDPAPSADRIFSMRFGSANTPPTRSDSNLGVFVIGKALADVNKITGVPGELEFTATLDATEANGTTLQEAGLFTAGNAGTPTPSDAPGINPGNPRMFARQIFPAVAKTAAIVVQASWRIAFTA